jgi:para-nitrobenzyl esterase
MAALPAAAALFGYHARAPTDWGMAMSGLRNLSGFALAAAVLFGSIDAAAAQTVATQDGLVEGVNENGMAVYKGIPFAAPPVGDLRWRAPEPAKPWHGVLKATAYKPRCMQVGPDYPFGPGGPMSEDCLTLNIWTPAKTANAKLPVMVWIYGGSFQNGSASDPFYLGDNLAKHGVVVVNINYRLGALGFLALPALTAESVHHTSGMYGILDMIAALKWVKANIAGFGGDPGNVTIFGQSAGSQAVNLLCASPLARGLFEKAIGESGAGFEYPGTPNTSGTLKSSEAYGTTLAAKLGASTLADLRRLPAEKVIAVGSDWPGIDGYVVPAPLYDIYAAGKENDVPILIGQTSGEGDNLMAKPLSAAGFKKNIETTYPRFADRILAMYPASSDAEAAKSQRLMLRDWGFGWNMWIWARLASKTGTHKVFDYYFDHRLPLPDQEPFKDWGVQHGAELFYVLQHYIPGWKWTARDKKIGDIMSSYWVNFARSGDPNGPGLPPWRAFTQSHQRVLHMDDPFAMEAVPNKPALDLIEDYQEQLRAGTK